MINLEGAPLLGYTNWADRNAEQEAKPVWSLNRFGWQPWATQYDAHMFQIFRSKELSEMFEFSGEDLWFLGLLAFFYILGKWWNSDMFQMSKSTGKDFVGELGFQVCSSRTICVEQMCLKRIPFVCPTNIFISHGMRRGGAKRRREQYEKVATRQQEIPTGSIQLAFGNCFDPMVKLFFVASSHCWILLVSVRMQNYEMLSCESTIDQAVLLSPYVG